VTQPVQEPLTQRSISSLQYGQNQLFRRPDPSGEGLLWPWVVLENSGQTLPGDGAFRESIFTQVYWDSSITPDPTTAGGTDPFGVASVDDGEGNDFWQLSIRIEGWYTFEIVHSIDDATGGSATDYFQQQIAQSAGTPFITDDLMGTVALWTPEIEAQQWIETYRTIWAISAGTPQIYETVVRQTTGLDKSVGGYTKVWYLGGLGGSTNNADWDVAIV
jgi:hypothetical protein